MLPQRIKGRNACSARFRRLNLFRIAALGVHARRWTKRKRVGRLHLGGTAC